MASSRSEYLKLPWRVLAFLINVAIFYTVHVFVTGSWQVSGGGQSLWLLSAIGWWTLGLLSAPWYTPPRDAIAAAAGALLALVTLDLSTAANLKDVLYPARAALIAYAVFVLVSGTIATLLKYGGPNERLRRLFFSIADRLSKGELLLGSAAIISIFGFYTDQKVVLLLTALWLVFALMRPVEFLLQLLLRMLAAVARREDNPPVGIVQRVDHPDIVRVSLNSIGAWNEGRVHIACLAGHRVGFLIPLFTQTQDSEIVGTGFCVGDASTEVDDYEVGDVYSSSRSDVLSDLMSKLCGADDAEIVGFVVEGSTVGAIQFEAARDRGLEEGFVVFCNLPVGRVFFQILDAQTKEETFRHNPRGTHVVRAVQLGRFTNVQGFKKYPWLPPMNSPVFRLTKESGLQVATPTGEFVIGTVPSTNMGLNVSLPELVEYHTAVLGVTGTGKTELALDIVQHGPSEREVA